MNEETRLKPRRMDAAEPPAANGGSSLVSLFDAERHDRRDQLLAEQGRLLKLVARGCGLDSCLTEITAAVGRLQLGARAAILVANEERTSFETAYSAEVPESFGANIKGARVEEFAIGTCGTAVFKNAPVTCTDVDADDRWAPEWRELCKSHGLFACHSQPVIGKDDEAAASLVIFFDRPHRPSEWEIEVAQFCAEMAGIAIQHHRSAETLRESEARLQRELSAARHLQAISTELIREDDPDDLYRKVLDAAVAIMGSEFGSMQLLHADCNELELLTFRGFHPESAQFWKWVSINSGSTCGQALATGERSVVADVQTCDFMAGTDDLRFYRKSGIRAVQSTPLLARGGHIVGMISTHWAEPHEPSGRDLRLLDVLARQAADLIERKNTETAIQAGEAFTQRLLASSSDCIKVLDLRGNILSLSEGGRKRLEIDDVAPLLGTPWPDFFRESDRETAQRAVANAAAGEPSRFEAVVPLASGELSWWNSVVNAITDGDGSPSKLLVISRDITDSKAAEAEAERRQEIFSELINRCPFGMYIVDSGFTIASMNQRSQEGAFANVRPVIGRPLDQAMHILWPEEVAEEIVGRFRHTLDSGEPFRSRDFVRPRGDIEQVEGYEWELHRTTLPDGEFGVICYYYDSTELREAQQRLAANERRQRLLINELNHRVKNSLSIVQALAQQTFDRAGVAREVRSAFEGRLEALAQAHNVLTREHWEAAELSEIFRAALDACGARDRVSTSGPPLRLEPRTSVTMTMAIHELCTNAIKYGALSVPGGRVSLEWRIDSERSRLTICWEEQDGPPVQPEGRPGFGSRMLRRALAAELKAEVDLDFRPSGVVCTIDAPVGALIHEGADADA